MRRFGLWRTVVFITTPAGPLISDHITSSKTTTVKLHRAAGITVLDQAKASKKTAHHQLQFAFLIWSSFIMTCPRCLSLTNNILLLIKYYNINSIIILVC